VSVDQVGSKDSDDTHGGLVQLIAEVSVDQVGSKDSDRDTARSAGSLRCVR